MLTGRKCDPGVTRMVDALAPSERGACSRLTLPASKVI